eukprot:CAMPEP_0179054772 /NCGR_PEP_ID=MMETSP0796-20121207/22959_1 /TAXON_ID=73915 /ORGANISM="Pyrodinium bahamense, Strain pbaha01" /LENGTH=207 /DNA_ID=CAMNT_0020751407 /DNA_START=130 /DNA_END=749 /DNA_ORIENTATION=-
MEEVAQHATAEDCWVTVDGSVYDVTKFLRVHPGGKGTLLAYAGKDATEAFFALHKGDVLDKYREKLFKGTLMGGEAKFTAHKATPREGMPAMEYVSEVPFAEPSWIRGGGWRSPFHNESHRAFRDAVRAFLHTHVWPDMAESEDQGMVPTIETYRAMGRNGLLASRIGTGSMPMVKHIPGLEMPGGLDPEKFDCFHEQIAHEEMGYL